MRGRQPGGAVDPVVVARNVDHIEQVVKVLLDDYQAAHPDSRRAGAARILAAELFAEWAALSPTGDVAPMAWNVAADAVYESNMNFPAALQRAGEPSPQEYARLLTLGCLGALAAFGQDHLAIGREDKWAELGPDPQARRKSMSAWVKGNKGPVGPREIFLLETMPVGVLSGDGPRRTSERARKAAGTSGPSGLLVRRERMARALAFAARKGDGQWGDDSLLPLIEQLGHDAPTELLKQARNFPAARAYGVSWYDALGTVAGRLRDLAEIEIEQELARGAGVGQPYHQVLADVAATVVMRRPTMVTDLLPVRVRPTAASTRLPQPANRPRSIPSTPGARGAAGAPGAVGAEAAASGARADRSTAAVPARPGRARR